LRSEKTVEISAAGTKIERHLDFGEEK